jgi:hypothetical protein
LSKRAFEPSSITQIEPSWLSSEAIIVVDLEHKPVKEVQRLDMKKRIRGLHEFTGACLALRGFLTQLE